MDWWTREASATDCQWYARHVPERVAQGLAETFPMAAVASCTVEPANESRSASQLCVRRDGNYSACVCIFPTGGISGFQALAEPCTRRGAQAKRIDLRCYIDWRSRLVDAAVGAARQKPDGAAFGADIPLSWRK